MQVANSLKALSLAVAAASALLGGCASKAPDVINISGLIPIGETKLPNVRAYEARGFDVRNYHGLLIDRADVYRGSEAGFGDVSEADRERIAAMLTSEFRRVLGAEMRVVEAPAPGVVRVHLTLVGIDQSRPMLSTALRLTPVGLVMTAAKGVTERPAPFVGDINVAGVAYDAETGRVLAAAQALISPSAVNLTSGLTPLRAAELSTTRAAEAFRDYLDRVKPRQ